MVNVQAVDEMVSQGLSGRAIAKMVGVSEATVRRILRSSREICGDGRRCGQRTRSLNRRDEQV